LHCDDVWKTLSNSICWTSRKLNKTDLSKFVVSLPLSYVVEKSYRYMPLCLLAECFGEQNHQKKTIPFPFQVLFSPYGYDHKVMDKFLCKKYLPHVKICARKIDGKKCKLAANFMEAAIHFLTEPFMNKEEILSQPEKHFLDDVSVNHAFVSNSSIWVIGPYIPEDEKGKPCENRLYYRIAAGVCFRTTVSGTYIEFIRSLSSSVDDELLTSPWNISFLNCSRNEKTDKNNFIKCRRMGVFLMCVIQELCIASETSLDLYLQTCYENSAFMWFITIGFVYASQHYGPIVDFDQVPKAGFPLCSDPEKELPKHLGILAKKGELTYTGTFDDTSEEVNMMIRLLCLKKRLCQWFPPMTTISNHAMFTEWLYSVPFPSPS